MLPSNTTEAAIVCFSLEQALLLFYVFLPSMSLHRSAFISFQWHSTGFCCIHIGATRKTLRGLQFKSIEMQFYSIKFSNLQSASHIRRWRWIFYCFFFSSKQVTMNRHFFTPPSVFSLAFVLLYPCSVPFVYLHNQIVINNTNCVNTFVNNSSDLFSWKM